MMRCFVFLNCMIFIKFGKLILLVLFVRFYIKKDNYNWFGWLM